MELKKKYNVIQKNSPSKTLSSYYHELFLIFKKTTQCYNDHKLKTLPISPYDFPS